MVGHRQGWLSGAGSVTSRARNCPTAAVCNSLALTGSSQCMIRSCHPYIPSLTYQHTCPRHPAVCPCPSILACTVSSPSPESSQRRRNARTHAPLPPNLYRCTHTSACPRDVLTNYEVGLLLKDVTTPWPNFFVRNARFYALPKFFRRQINLERSSSRFAVKDR